MEKKKLIQNVLESLLAGLMVFLLTITNLFYSIDYMLKDALYQIPRGIDSNIKIVAIDEKTLDALGPIQTWSRHQYAELIDKLNTYEDAKPSVIAFDIIFSGHVDEEGDQAFAKMAEKSGNIVVASQFLYSEKSEIEENGLRVFPIDGVVNPYDELMQVADIGYANVAQDSDGTVRRIIPDEMYNGNSYNSFSKMIYETYCKQQGVSTHTIKTDKYGRSLINYSGRPFEYECISMIDILEGNIDCRALKNSIVLIGAYATGMQDNFKVPNGRSSQMYGVEIHANILQAFLEGRFSVNGNPFVFGIIFGIIAAILHFIFKRSKVWVSAVFLVVGIGLELLTGVLLNNNGTTISLVYFPIVLVVSYIYCLAINYILENIKRKKVLNAFKKYVAPEIVEEIAKKGDFQIKLGGENRDIAVLFVDIRGFTTMSELLEPEQVVEILNQYLNLTTNAIFKNRGTLDKFVGDATMAVFNSPFDLDDYEFRAVCAAMDIVAGGAALEEKLLKEFGRSVGFGVGVNCGPAVVGNVGCEFRMDFTAIGDTVNTAARLEANAKKGQVLISDTIYDRVKDRVCVEPVGEIPLKGKSKGVFVYSVVSVKRENEGGVS